MFSSLYSNFILNLFIVYKLNSWANSSINTFPLKNHLFNTIKLVTNSIKSKFICSSSEIAFDGKGSWSFGNDLTRNINNSSSSYSDNEKKMKDQLIASIVALVEQNKFLVLSLIKQR